MNYKALKNEKSYLKLVCLNLCLSETNKQKNKNIEKLNPLTKLPVRTAISAISIQNSVSLPFPPLPFL